MTWTSLKLFWHVFHRQSRCNKSRHTNLRNFQISCYVWKWAIQRWNLTSRISRTKFKFSNIVSKSDHAGLGGCGWVRGLRLTVLPLFTQSNIFDLLPSNEKSFTLYDGFGKSALLWSFEPRNLWRRIHLWDGWGFEKCYFIMLRGPKRDRSVPL